jgi:hypothetical protein
MTMTPCEALSLGTDPDIAPQSPWCESLSPLHTPRQLDLLRVPFGYRAVIAIAVAAALVVGGLQVGAQSNFVLSRWYGAP